MEFLLASDYELTDRSFEFPDSDTETLPDQSMSVREILTRFAQGTLPPVVQYDGGFDTDDPEDMEVDPTLAPDFDLTDGGIKSVIEWFDKNKKAIFDTVALLS